jgi:N-acetylglucosaminyldiphosphoundecaprenol N-acetyl-beta-D-mannosaminyltransferase
MSRITQLKITTSPSCPSIRRPSPPRIDPMTSYVTPARESFKVLGVRVDAVQIPDVISRMAQWIEERSVGNYIAVTGMHGVMEAQQSAQFKQILNRASLTVADGMPLVWVGKVHRLPLRRRVYGPELMESFCRATGDRFRHFFYGGAPGVADQLGEAMKQRFGIRVAGAYSPPFRHLNPDEERTVIDLLQTSRPDVLWVGMSTPKQEAWMAEYRERAGVPVLVGVGAAFDFFTGRTRQAPPWMREHGFEWLFRLAAEPRRLWRRYVIYGPKFAWNVALELAGIRRFT